MHILYVIDSLAMGGAERSLAVMAPGYAAAGVSLDVAYLRERPGLHRELRDAGAGLFCLAGRGGRVGTVERLQRLIRDRRPDLIHTTLFEADLAGRIAGSLTGTPVVSSLVTVAYGREHLGDPSLRRWKVRAAHFADAVTARRVVRFHAITNYVAEVMGRRLWIPRARIDVVPRGRDPHWLGSRSPQRRVRARASLNIAPDVPLVLAIGRQEHAKGLDVLLQALPLVLAERPQARLLIAGPDGNQTPILRRAVQAMHLHGVVRFLGPRQDIPELLCGADVFVLPSRREGLAGALLEAMALETPIVVSNVPAALEVLGSREAARFVDVGNPERLASAIVATLANPAEAATRASLARRRFGQRFSMDVVLDGMLTFYSRALGSTPTSRTTTAVEHR